MEFNVEEIENNIKVTIVDGKNILASAVCYYKETPKIDQKNIGCIGNFEANSLELAVQLLKKCEKILKEKEIKVLVAPMNGNTWKQYRTLKYSSGESEFLLENVNPIKDNDAFLNAGFKEMYTYTSTKGRIKDVYSSEALTIAEENLKEENINIRKFNKENYIEDLKKIYNISRQSFTRNPLYTPINEEEFIKQYEQYISMVDEDLILMVEKENQEVGFVFCIPNFNELKEGKNLETLILKTIAVLPEYEDLAIGNILVSKIAKIAQDKGFKEWIFAFMYSNNTSQKMAKRNNTKVIREYALYGKEI